MISEEARALLAKKRITQAESREMIVELVADQARLHSAVAQARNFVHASRQAPGAGVVYRDLSVAIGEEAPTPEGWG